MNMKNSSTRFLAIVVIIVMTLGCTMVAHADDGNPYQSSYYDVSRFGVVVSFDTPVLAEPAEDAEQIGMLNAGTICRTLGEYLNNDGEFFFIVDLTILDGFDTEYGFVNSMNLYDEPKWVMLTSPTDLYSSPWTPGLFRSYTGLTGLALVLQIEERWYAIQHIDHFGITSFVRDKLVKPYSPEGQKLYLLPIDTMIYDEDKNPIKELPALTIMTYDNLGYDPDKGTSFHVTANPGTEDELTGWVFLEVLMPIIN